MRRMISQKQIEGLDQLNNTFTVDNSNLNISDDIEFINIEASVPWIKFTDTDKVGHGFIGNYGEANTLYVGTVDEQVGGENITFEDGAVNISVNGEPIAEFGKNESVINNNLSVKVDGTVSGVNIITLYPKFPLNNPYLSDSGDNSYRSINAYGTPTISGGADTYLLFQDSYMQFDLPVSVVREMNTNAPTSLSIMHGEDQVYVETNTKIVIGSNEYTWSSDDECYTVQSYVPLAERQQTVQLITQELRAHPAFDY